jgi:exonuclease SbcD
MRVLHTADWHVGRRLGRFDRDADHRAALDRLVEIADERAVDVVAGDLLESARPSVDALRLVLSALGRLAARGRPVVAIAGNHDPPALFELLAPLLRDRGIHLVGDIHHPDEGGLVEVTAGGTRVVLACLPFLREARAVDFTTRSQQWHGAYADRVRRLAEAYSQALVARASGAVKLLVGHFLVDGVLLGGGGGPRGERPLHLGQAWAATDQAIPSGPQYVAMGHIHAPQRVPGAPVPAEYAGSLLELDFGEAGEAKRVVIVEVEPGAPARVESVAFDAGRKLVRASGRAWELEQRRDELAGVWLDLVVHTEGPEPGLADWARKLFPHLVRVRAEYPRAAVQPPSERGNKSWDQLWIEWRRCEGRGEPDPNERDAFLELLREQVEAGC